MQCHGEEDVRDTVNACKKPNKSGPSLRRGRATVSCRAKCSKLHSIFQRNTLISVSDAGAIVVQNPKLGCVVMDALAKVQVVEHF